MNFILSPLARIGAWIAAAFADVAVIYGRGRRDARRDLRQATANITTIESSNDQFNEAACRATADLYMLLSRTPQGVYPYAGIPWYSTVFGRDGIITAMMALFLVLWLVSQDQKIKDAVQRAFTHPFASMTEGTTGLLPKKPEVMAAEVQASQGSFDSAAMVELNMLRRVVQDLMKSLQDPSNELDKVVKLDVTGVLLLQLGGQVLERAGLAQADHVLGHVVGVGGFEIGAASTGTAKWRIEWDSASDSLDFNWVG